MNHPWQQPIRPMEVRPNNKTERWYQVIFIRPITYPSTYLNGIKTQGYTAWEVISAGGRQYSSHDSEIREVAS